LSLIFVTNTTTLTRDISSSGCTSLTVLLEQKSIFLTVVVASPSDDATTELLASDDDATLADGWEYAGNVGLICGPAGAVAPVGRKSGPTTDKGCKKTSLTRIRIILG